MPRPVSQKPAEFGDFREEDYWHSAQDIAYRAGAAIVLRDGETYLVFPDREQRICRPEEPSRIWFETWKRLDEDFPLLSRSWVGGRAVTKPGEMVQIRKRVEDMQK